MKIIFENRYIVYHVFDYEHEFNTFINNHGTTKKLILGAQGGKYFYSYVCHDSLTSDKLFMIGFDTDVEKEELHFLIWKNNHLIVFNNGSETFLINDKMEILMSFFNTTPLIGFHITKSDSLLVLAEAELKLVSKAGDILMNEQFDLLNDYYIKDDKLYIKNDFMDRVVKIL